MQENYPNIKKEKKIQVNLTNEAQKLKHCSKDSISNNIHLYSSPMD